MPDILTTLVAERAIRRLISLYCGAVSRHDPDAIAELFAPDARVTIAHLPERVGREAIVEGFRATLAAFSYLHQKCDTGLIDVDGDTARAQLDVVELNRAVGADSFNMIFGTYEDEFRRREEGWRFACRRFTLQFRAVLPAAQLQELPGFVPAFAFAP
jgi:ketosteroid isomerase-like protein